MESNNPLAGDGKRVLLYKTRLHLITNLLYFVLFLFQIHLLIFLPNSCIVVWALSPTLGHPIERPTAENCTYVKRCSVRLCFLI